MHRRRSAGVVAWCLRIESHRAPGGGGALRREDGFKAPEPICERREAVRPAPANESRNAASARPYDGSRTAARAQDTHLRLRRLGNDPQPARALARRSHTRTSSAVGCVRPDSPPWFSDYSRKSASRHVTRRLSARSRVATRSRTAARLPPPRAAEAVPRHLRRRGSIVWLESWGASRGARRLPLTARLVVKARSVQLAKSPTTAWRADRSTAQELRACLRACADGGLSPGRANVAARAAAITRSASSRDVRDALYVHVLPDAAAAPAPAWRRRAAIRRFYVRALEDSCARSYTVTGDTSGARTRRGLGVLRGNERVQDSPARSGRCGPRYSAAPTGPGTESRLPVPRRGRLTAASANAAPDLRASRRGRFAFGLPERRSRGQLFPTRPTRARVAGLVPSKSSTRVLARSICEGTQRTPSVESTMETPMNAPVPASSAAALKRPRLTDATTRGCRRAGDVRARGGRAIRGAVAASQTADASRSEHPNSEAFVCASVRRLEIVGAPARVDPSVNIPWENASSKRSPKASSAERFDTVL